MTDLRTFYSTGHAEELACHWAIWDMIAAADSPGDIAVYGPFQIIRIVANGDPDAEPPVPMTTESDGLWYFNALSRGETLTSDWQAQAPTTPAQQWS
jgi:hypothetical protein